MANLQIKYPRIFTDEILKVTEETLIIDDVENEKNEKFLNNDVYLKEQLEELSENVEKNKTHTHKIKEVDNLRFDLYTNTELSVGKYTRVIESELVNKASTGVYAKYNVELDYTNYFDLELYINQEKILTEEMPKVELYVANMPSYIHAYATIQADPDWQIWDVDVHLKIDKAFKKLKLRQLNLNGNSDVLHVSSAYKVQDTLSTTKYAKIIEATKTTPITVDDKEKLDGIEEKAEENQNAFSNVKVGAIKISANGKTAQIELISGDNISITGDNATKKIKIEVANLGDVSTLQTNSKNNLVVAVNEILKKSNITEDEIGSLATLSTATKDNIVAAINECFQNASSGKVAIANAAGTDGNATFQAIANELNEQKKVLFNAHKMDTQSTSIRAQAKTIDVYVHNHLPSMIVNNGGKLVANGGAAVTQSNSTLDTLYYSIQNLAAVKNNLINAATNEKNQWVANYNDMVNQKNAWYQNYVNMEADRNNWMNIANSKKSYYETSMKFDPYNSNLDQVFDIGFIPSIAYIYMRHDRLYMAAYIGNNVRNHINKWAEGSTGTINANASYAGTKIFVKLPSPYGDAVTLSIYAWS